MKMDNHTLDHLYRVFYQDLGMCGCGNPEDAYNLIRDILSLAPFYEDQRWRLVETLTGGGAVHHIVLSVLDQAELIEHGSSINGSWLTTKGSWFLNAARTVEFNKLDDGRLPHDGGDCSDACWTLPQPDTRSDQTK